MKKDIDILHAVWYNIYRREGKTMKHKKITTIEIAELIIKAVVAAAALITAIKWW